MRLFEIDSNFYYDDDELELIFSDYVSNKKRLGYFEIDRIPEKYRYMPKSKTVYRGIHLPKSQVESDLKNGAIKLRITSYASFSTTVSEALPYAKGMAHNPYDTKKARDAKDKYNTIGIVYKKRPMQDEIIVNIKSLPFNELFRTEKEILINTVKRHNYWSQISKENIVKFTEFMW